MKDRFVVYNKEGFVKGFKYLFGFGGLEDFIKRRGSWKFGNTLKDKRWAYETNRDSLYTFTWNRIGLQTVEYIVYEVVNGEEVLYPVKSINKLLWQHDWEISRKLAKEERPSYFQGRRCLGEHYRDGLPARPHSYTNWSPGTKRSAGSSLRRLRTTQERRMYEAHKDLEEDVKLRAKRSTRNLPNSWDDYWRKDAKWGSPNSWKRQKKRKQWM